MRSANSIPLPNKPDPLGFSGTIGDGWPGMFEIADANSAHQRSHTHATIQTNTCQQPSTKMNSAISADCTGGICNYVKQRREDYKNVR